MKATITTSNEILVTVHSHACIRHGISTPHSIVVACTKKLFIPQDFGSPQRLATILIDWNPKTSNTEWWWGGAASSKVTPRGVFRLMLVLGAKWTLPWRHEVTRDAPSAPRCAPRLKEHLVSPGPQTGPPSTCHLRQRRCPHRHCPQRRWSSTRLGSCQQRQRNNGGSLRRQWNVAARCALAASRRRRRAAAVAAAGCLVSLSDPSSHFRAQAINVFVLRRATFLSFSGNEAVSNNDSAPCTKTSPSTNSLSNGSWTLVKKLLGKTR